MRSLSRRSPILGRGYDLAVQACGPLACNMYVVICNKTGHAAVIDPSFQNPFELDSLLKKIQKFEDDSDRKKTVDMKHILLTHGHADHVCGIVEMLKIWPDSKLHLHALEEENYCLAPEVALHFGLHVPLQAGHSSLPEPTDELTDGQILNVGSSIQFDVKHIPGHAPGHVAFIDDRQQRLPVDGDAAKDDDIDGNENISGDGAVIISGDLLFQGGVGRTDFNNANIDDLNASLRRLYESYSDDSIVLSGHTTPTSLGRERTTNPFVQLALKRPIEWYNDAVERHKWIK
mmetsp:Transcript_18255/g.44088  ORF Transcript_18255/g.44088 Transcript_18255/m.44088 type:complete len:289 (-) Transcript_18255:47-913(-)|eukprot:CAMPEP_0113443550 /NCGR_PEP_ID=MMETSP0014_2-20120614/2199_1 /TAXON_ID=2857 /ORGANISM="Nitzschia sp." /LENGTH=288 /DNA_ID=CAMNT_0000334515 /DNA_START=49 /DNA_END=915 /DNA_ORIENTATION=- /assembly_acc=CAM_ASM_000159